MRIPHEIQIDSGWWTKVFCTTGSRCVWTRTSIRFFGMNGWFVVAGQQFFENLKQNSHTHTRLNDEHFARWEKVVVDRWLVTCEDAPTSQTLLTIWMLTLGVCQRMCLNEANVSERNKCDEWVEHLKNKMFNFLRSNLKFQQKFIDNP